MWSSSSNWIWLCWETYTLKWVWCSMKTTFNVYVSQRIQTQFEDVDHNVYISFRWVTTTLSSLRTITCDTLFVPSGFRCPWSIFPGTAPHPSHMLYGAPREPWPVSTVCCHEGLPSGNNSHRQTDEGFPSFCPGTH